MRKGLICFMEAISICIFLLTGCGEQAPYIENASDISLPVEPWDNSMDSSTTTPPPISDTSEDETEPVTTPVAVESNIDSNQQDNRPADTTPTSTIPSIQVTIPFETDPPETQFIEDTTPPVTQQPESTQTEPPEPAATDPEITIPPATEDSDVSKPTAPNPIEEIDLSALVQYGLQYAAEVHGYQISPGVRDGYYPAYSCYFTSMKEGQAAIRGCVDDTTNAILAVPGTKIVAVIDGVICRARIDIVITPIGSGSYRISVFYG